MPPKVLIKGYHFNTSTRSKRKKLVGHRYKCHIGTSALGIHIWTGGPTDESGFKSETFETVRNATKIQYSNCLLIVY